MVTFSQIALSLSFLTISILSNCDVVAATPVGLGKYRWGMHPDRDLKQIADPWNNVKVYLPASPADSSPSIFGVKVSGIAYFFYKDSFYRGSAWVAGRKELEIIKTALFKEYGKPTLTSESAGIWTWSLNQSDIEIRLTREEGRSVLTYVKGPAIESPRNENTRSNASFLGSK